VRVAQRTGPFVRIIAIVGGVAVTCRVSAPRRFERPLPLLTASSIPLEAVSVAKTALLAVYDSQTASN
jgi:hypothetical protein